MRYSWDSIGLVSNACGYAGQWGCEGVYQNGGAQCPMGIWQERDHNIPYSKLSQWQATSDDRIVKLTIFCIQL